MALTNENVRKIVSWVVDHGLSTNHAAEEFGVTQRRIQQLVRKYRETGKIPELKKRGRKKSREYSDDVIKRIKEIWKKFRMGAVAIAERLRERHGVKIDNNKVHDVLLENNMARENDNKKGRKKPWVRYERNHSLSAVHMDWHQNKHGKWICAVLDDSSRKVLSAGEYDGRSAEASIELLDEAFEKYNHVRSIREVITDHGTAFYANKRDSDGEADHPFENYCKEKGIKHLLCKYNHPQSNGKIEKWFDTYEKHRYRFDSMDDFIDFYNEIKPHFSLDLKTPEKIFWKRLRSYILGNFFEMTEEGDKI